jgi:hypothetical protein
MLRSLQIVTQITQRPILLPKIIIDAEYCVEREGEDFDTLQFDFEAHKPKILNQYIENKNSQSLLGKRPPTTYYK